MPRYPAASVFRAVGLGVGRRQFNSDGLILAILQESCPNLVINSSIDDKGPGGAIDVIAFSRYRLAPRGITSTLHTCLGLPLQLEVGCRLLPSGR